MMLMFPMLRHYLIVLQGHLSKLSTSTNPTHNEPACARALSLSLNMELTLSGQAPFIWQYAFVTSVFIWFSCLDFHHFLVEVMLKLCRRSFD